ncbi:MAG TPA: ribosome small subunit-dependent GTPase A [Caulobacteraceae bacterium]|nr:ribosome small subunit-dependent GTPase A [Caulobacteraceae bacterium]
MLKEFGWSEELQRQFAPHAAAGLAPARVIAQHRGRYLVTAAAGEVDAEIGGRLAREATPVDLPVAGDFVAIEPAGPGFAIIRQVLHRRTLFTRWAAGTRGRRQPRPTGQPVAANADLALLAEPLVPTLNLRRLERYLAAAWSSGARPAVVLTKADLCADLDAAAAEVAAVTFDVPMLAVSAVTGAGLDAVRALLAPGITAALLGASGAGKSTLINGLLGEDRLRTGGVRENDGRGRHTTTHRELILLPGGALVLDTPGMRELGLWDAEDGVAVGFADIESLAADCRFRNCSHCGEPGCAVRSAVEAGALDPARLASFRKLAREAAFEAARDDPLLRAERRKRWIAIHKANRRRARDERRL